MKGSTNKKVDTLSRYYTNDWPGKSQPGPQYVNVDRRIDPQFDYLTELWKLEIQSSFPEQSSNDEVHAAAVQKTLCK